MIYRKANRDDTAAIANLHAESWQNTYRGMMSDFYLDNNVTAERLSVWQKRFAKPKENQCVFVATNEDRLAGFVCIYGADDAKWGTLIDNLHVRPNLKGQGIGSQLLQKAMDWAHENYPQYGIYLWVFEDNTASRRFYELMGGIHTERELHINEDGTKAFALKYIFKSLDF